MTNATTLPSRRTPQVTLNDSRVFVGEFQCLDKQGNLVLGRASELMGPGGGERPVGMALVPAAQRRLVEVQVRCCTA
jgi:small nuclear ribonucleoprotein (snRNP)-like protein